MTSTIDLFISSLAALNRQPVTLQQYRDDLRRFEKFLQQEFSLSLSAVDAINIRGYMLEAYMQQLFQRGLEVSTRNKYIMEIKEFFTYLYQSQLIDVNPSTVLRCIKEKDTPEKKEKDRVREQKIYTSQQLEAFMNTIVCGREYCNDRRDAAIIALIIASGGMRASEVCGLNISDVDAIRTGILNCRRKGGNWRDIAVSPFVLPYLDAYLEKRPDAAPDEPLFVSTHGERVNRKTLWKTLAHKQKKAELATGIHILRHMMLSEITRTGGGAAARDIAGHSSISITNRYAHSTQEERTELVSSNAYAKALAV